MATTERFLLAMALVYTLPWLVWRLGRTDHYAPLVVVQILMGIALGPGVLGAAWPEYYDFVFTPQVIQSLNGVAWWAVMVFVWIAGIELDLVGVWHDRRESSITAGLALGVPLLAGAAVAAVMSQFPGWIGANAQGWQFTVGVGMACAVTALPILVLFLEKLGMLRRPIGQRVLRYASLDDVLIWGVLALILLDWARVGKQLGFLVAFAVAAKGFRAVMPRLELRDRWHASLVWLIVCAFGADWCGLHYMVGAFLSGLVIEASWFGTEQRDALRHHVLLIVMPVFFLSTGLRTSWSVGGWTVFLAAAALLAASVSGKLAGTALAGRVLGWKRGEAWLIGWLLQTKALIMIIFANVLLDRGIITSATFTALLLMAVGSTMLSVPVASPALRRLESSGMLDR
jgi:Kef-type K+ transport system membrane component KefB